MTFLLTHPDSISLTTLSKPLPSTITPTTLALPSRYPPKATPQVTTSPPGHIYLYSRSSHVVWEYDNKGKRISELSFPNARVHKALGLDEKKLMVNLKDKDELRVMRKNGTKWDCVDTLRTSNGEITALISNVTSTLVAAGLNQGELVVFDLSTGQKIVVPLGKRVNGPISPLLTFCPNHPSTLLLPTSSSLLRITLSLSSSSTDVREIPVKGPILDVTFSPVSESTDGSQKGGLCAVLRPQGEVTLIGIDSDSAPKIMQFGEELEGLMFTDGATLAGRTKKGSLLIKDLRALSKPPVPISSWEPITSIQLLPNITRSSRPSLLPSSTSSHRSRARTPLGDRQTGNVPTPPPEPVLKGKGPIRENTTVLQEDNVKAQTATRTERIVSAPVSTASKQPRQSTSTARSTSGPIPLPVNPTVHRLRNENQTSSRLRSATPIIREEDEEDVQSDTDRQQSAGSSTCQQNPRSERSVPTRIISQPEHIEGYDREPSIHLDWALQPPRESVKEREVIVTDNEMIEELRRELRDLKMDMLRMGRGLRNEIRQATKPLLKELEDNKEVMERQRREIERLRRGY
ncbi:hypothetical protein V865_002012 [Kwoniella europaea PYCC6329]|uniref:Uncharacterized protein n=1 Tax=Kwoniella europaea PYCC6329 TaxID=1423913 RepID=A0AAX4KCP9_9TREE